MKELEMKLPREIDHRSAEKWTKILRKKIAEERAKQYIAAIAGKIEAYTPAVCILDFQDVTFMDSSGIGLILGRYKQMKELGGEIVVKNTSRQVDCVLRLSGLYQIIRKWERRNAS